MKLLQQFDFDIEYVKCKENVVVDSLSKRPMANAILCIRNSLIDEIKAHYVNDDIFKFLVESLSKDFIIVEEIKTFKFYKLKDGMLHFSAKIYIPKFEEYKFNILLIFIQVFKSLDLYGL